MRSARSEGGLAVVSLACGACVRTTKLTRLAGRGFDYLDRTAFACHTGRVKIPEDIGVTNFLMGWADRGSAERRGYDQNRADKELSARGAMVTGAMMA